MKTLLLILALALTACASQDYALYAKAQGDVDIARHNADAAKYKAMADIAATGDQSAKVAAVMALAMGQGNSPQQQLQAPQASTALQWAQVLVPGFTQVAGIAANMRVGIAQSDNSAKVAVSTNDAFVGIAGKIQAPSTTTTTTTSSLGGSGVLGSGTYNANPTTTTDNHTLNPSTTSKTCTLAPVTNILTCQ